MARLTSRQKSERVLHLLMGLRDAATASALVSVGFRDGDLQEGWALLRRTTREGIDPKALPRPGPVPSPRTMQAPLEAWQNRWWPVVEATLHRHTPDLARGVFHKLERAAEPLMPTMNLLARLRDVASGRGDLAEEKRKATRLLAQRGLTAAVIAEGDALVRDLQRVESTGLDPDIETREQARLAVAEKELWAYYLEWSRLARAGIRDRRVLRSLGFFRSRASGANEDAEAEAATPAKPAAIPRSKTTGRRRRR